MKIVVTVVLTILAMIGLLLAWRNVLLSAPNLSGIAFILMAIIYTMEIYGGGSQSTSSYGTGTGS